MKSEGFKGLSSLGDALLKHEREQTQALFDTVLKGKMDKVPAGDFASELPPITSVTILPVRSEHAQTGVARYSLNAVVNYATPEGKRKHIT